MLQGAVRRQKDHESSHGDALAEGGGLGGVCRKRRHNVVRDLGLLEGVTSIEWRVTIRVRWTAMAAAGAGVRFDPVRLQKFFFLLDRELDGECGCPHFAFRPYRYGPFD